MFPQICYRVRMYLAGHQWWSAACGSYWSWRTYSGGCLACLGLWWYQWVGLPLSFPRLWNLQAAAKFIIRLTKNRCPTKQTWWWKKYIDTPEKAHALKSLAEDLSLPKGVITHCFYTTKFTMAHTSVVWLCNRFLFLFFTANSNCDPKDYQSSMMIHSLFSLTRQNSRVFWLSKLESKSTAKFGSICFSRRYMGPVRKPWRCHLFSKAGSWLLLTSCQLLCKLKVNHS